MDTAGVFLVCGDFNSAVRRNGPEPNAIELAFGRCEILWPPSAAPSANKHDGWGWHDVVGFIRTAWILFARSAAKTLATWTQLRGPPETR